jgi:hypothetical protein
MSTSGRDAYSAAVKAGSSMRNAAPPRGSRTTTTGVRAFGQRGMIPARRVAVAAAATNPAGRTNLTVSAMLMAPLLGLLPDVELLGVAEDGERAVALAAEHRPDVGQLPVNDSVTVSLSPLNRSSSRTR